MTKRAARQNRASGHPFPPSPPLGSRVRGPWSRLTDSALCCVCVCVRRPQNVYVVRDVMSVGYIGGCDVAFFAKDGGNFTAAAAQENIAKRLANESDTISGRVPSLLAFPAWEAVLDKYDTAISVTTRLLPWELQGGSNASGTFPGGQVAFDRYSQALGLRAIHFGACRPLFLLCCLAAVRW